jgi:hypothetical protein
MKSLTRHGSTTATVTGDVDGWMVGRSAQRVPVDWWDGERIR